MCMYNFFLYVKILVIYLYLSIIYCRLLFIFSTNWNWLFYMFYANLEWARYFQWISVLKQVLSLFDLDVKINLQSIKCFSGYNNAPLSIHHWIKYLSNMANLAWCIKIIRIIIGRYVLFDFDSFMALQSFKSWFCFNKFCYHF